MGLLKIAAFSALGYAGYKAFEKKRNTNPAAFAFGQDGDVRDAGPHAMRDESSDSWNMTDEESDASFPASDPPANY